MGAIEHPPILSLAPWGIPDHVFYAWVVMGILVLVSLAATRNLQMAPRGVQNFMEVVLEQFLTLLDEVIGHEGRRFLPLIATLGLFILTSNLLGLVPGLVAPTANMYTTIACAVIVILYLALVARVLLRLLDEEDLFTTLAAAGLTAQLGGQAFINILVNLQLFPSKGMTLPLISYGGSSTIAICLGVGFLLAITRRNPFIKRERFSLRQLGPRQPEQRR